MRIGSDLLIPGASQVAPSPPTARKIPFAPVFARENAAILELERMKLAGTPLRPRPDEFNHPGVVDLTIIPDSFYNSPLLRNRFKF